MNVPEAQTILGSSNCNRSVILNLILSIPAWNILGPQGNSVTQYEPGDVVIYQNQY